MNEWQTFSELVRTILMMSATGGVIALLLFALKPVIKNRFPKSVQYYLWCLALVAFLVPFSVFVSLPFTTPMSQIQEVLNENIKTTVERREQFSQEQYGVEYEALEPQQQIEISFEEVGLVKGRFNDYLLLLLISIGGVSFFMDASLYTAYVIKLKRKRIEPLVSEQALLKNLCNTAKCPRLYRNSLTSTPMLIGVFRPVIYLPDREYSQQQFQNIMLHELTHLKRHDVMIKWIAALAVYVHWFNPFAYLVRREIDRACELACDEAVVNHFNTDEKQSYGDTLIEMASDMKKSRVLVSTTMCEEKKTLKDRLNAIMHSKKHTKKVIACSSVLLAIALFAIVVLGASANQGSAVDALYRKYGNEAAVIKPQSIITEVDAGDNGTVIFYYNANNNLACAIVEKSLFGYTVVKNGAELTVEGKTPVSVMAGQYSDADKWRAWGILRDREITKAIIDGREATIVEAGDLRLFYTIGDGKIPENDYYTFYNGSGGLVWEIGKTSLPEIYIDGTENSVRAAFYQNGFDFDYDDLPVLTLTEETAVLKINLPDTFEKSVQLGEDYYTYSENAGEVEKETYDLQKDENNEVSIKISRRGNIKDEEAVYFLKNEQGTFVFKVILPLDVE